MWTNIFKIAGLHQISWFQFLPNEFDFNTLPDKSVKWDKKEATTSAVLSAHLQLQKEGFLSAWTNSFVGPWDPSQGLHNPDEKIKLWLFLPGQYSYVVEKAQHAVARLRVLASGLWVAPGDSEEVAAAISQALRNCIERALRGLSYVRFGDAFSKYHPFTQNEELFRRGQPVAEFIFAATEETIFVHVIISAKHVRTLSNSDTEPFLSSSCRRPNDRISVIVSPHGMRGRLTGYCPADLVKQVYLSSGKSRGSNGIVGLPYHRASQGSGPAAQLRGQNCYVEVTFGCHDKLVPENVNFHGNFSQHNATESPAARLGTQRRPSDKLSVFEKMFVYPSEAVLVPVMQTSFARSSLKRFWLQNWVGPSLSGSSLFMHGLDFDSDDKVDRRGGSSLVPSGTRSQHGYRSSSNSNSSSNCSMSSSSSDSDRRTLGAGDLEADADSLMSTQSGLSQVHNDGLKLGSKRPRTGTSDSFSQAGMVLDPSVTGYGTTEVNLSITGATNEQIGSQWGWDDDDRGIGMDIQALLSEFGDFGDFFENDSLPFGEPPGSAESQALIYPTTDGGELCSSPSNSVMDVSDQMLLPAAFSTFDSFNHLQAPATVDDLASKNEGTKSSAPGQVTCIPSSFSGEFDHVLKAEALMTFAPEYGGVETPKSEVSSVIFRSPYIPKSCKVDSASSSNNYVYSATPPSPCDGSDEKAILPTSMRAYVEMKDSNSVLKSRKYYTHVESRKRQTGGSNNYFSKGDLGGAPSQFSVYSETDGKPNTAEVRGGSLKEDSFQASSRTVLATEDECLLCQASMCRLRHTLLSSCNSSPTGLNGLSGCSTPNLSHADSSTMVDNISGKSELKKKEIIPVRIAGDIDGGILDGHLTAPVGVWRSVGIPKVSKTSTSSMEVCPSISHNSFIEESMLSYGLRQPLQELLDGIALLVQQATSFVDVALDADCGDGPYGWLALQEQSRRGFSCGPSMVHAGCGGLLASAHSLDIAGIELVDPLSAGVQSSLTISLLQSDIKTALKSAFSNVDGPLSVIDWCRGRSPSNESGMTCDGLSAESIASASDGRDSSNTVTLSVGEPMSPSLTSAGGASSLRADGSRGEEVGTSLSELDKQHCSRIRPTLSVVPFPSILVGYQDDWLKTSASSLQVWEKAPLEPYATAKHMSYYVVCPNIDPLTMAATDFFLQLGTVYETCKLGTHVPQSLGNEMEIDSGKTSPGFVLLDCPQSMKIDTNNASMLGSISDYFLCLSNGWDLTSYLKTLSKVLKTLKLGSPVTVSAKDGNGGPCTVVYVVCPFPEPLAVLQTVVESSIAIGSVIRSSDKEKRSMMHNQVAKALSFPASVDESFSNVLTLTGFSMPKLVLQIVTVDAIFRVTSPSINELIILKEIAFTVYNKARRISRGASGETTQSLSMAGRSHSVSPQMTSNMWKDCIGSRIVGTPLQRESELDAGLRPGAWDNSWQTARSGGHGSDPNRIGDAFPLDEIHCLFEPLFILAEPGSLERGFSPFLGNSVDSSKLLSDDCTSTSFVQSSASTGPGDNGPASQHDSLDSDGFASGHQKSLPSLHCCYGWTEDWRWMVCIWTDSRGELLDSYIYPFGGVSSRQDTKGLQSLFIQILQQGCQILQACSPDGAIAKPRDLVITRIGCFFEFECQEWQKALYSAGGSEVKKWSLQLRRSLPDGIPASSNGNSLQQQEMSLMQDRALPSSSSPMYSPHSSKASSFIKGGIGQPSSRKQLMGGHAVMDNSKGLLQWVQSISFVSVSIDHSLKLVHQADMTSPGASQGSTTSGQSSYLEGYTAVKSLGSTSASYVLIPSPSMRFLPPAILQLPTCLTADSPPLAHLLHSKGSAMPLSTAFVVSKAVPSMRKSPSKEEWPSVLSVSLVDYYGDKLVKKQGGGSGRDSKDFEVETHIILNSIAAELHALSWMTVSPAYLERRSALPFHCDMVLRLRRLLHFADKELTHLPEKVQA